MSNAAAMTAALLLTAGWAHQPAPAPEPRPTVPPPAATAAPSELPSPGPLPTPASTPSIPASPVPSPTATPVYHFVYTPPPANATGPRILEIDISDQTLHPNSDVALRVVTTPEVSSVSAFALGREVAIPQTSPGVFAAQSHIPGIPFFLLRTYDVEFRAATANGQVASITLPIHLVR